MRVSFPSAISASLAASMALLSLPNTNAQTSRTVAKVQAREYPTLLQGTPVMLLLDQTVNSEHSRMGQRVAFEVSRDVELGDRVVIPAGALALGTITQASRQHLLGHPGRVSVNIDAVRLPGGQVVPLSISPDVEDEGLGTRDDAITASLLPPPVTPRLLSAHRRDAVIPEGTEVRAFVRRDTVVVEQTASVSN
jgi:hypothetical protein